METTNNLLIAI